ncbi:MAG: Sulfur incorporation enzyme [Candidatus Alkanophagales archaeon MCA70_species_2]|nr:Sulfur incorporation enzyme [Candidatus Alkanophaga liquidiphilum]
MRIAEGALVSVKRRTISEINEKIRGGEAVVMTAKELCDAVRGGEDVRFEDVDIVTAATCGVMSGTFAILSFQVAEPNTFERASRVFLNGVPAFVGPCPNERLGIVDVMVYGTAHRDRKYGGGHLFRDLVLRREISVEVETKEGKRIETTVTLDEIPFAKLCSTRNAFRNYLAFVNPKEGAVPTIFSVKELEGPFKELTFSGCGELNPLEKDPTLGTIGVGTKILMSGAPGFIIERGTRSTPEKPNLMGIADMHEMLPEFLGGFVTSAGPEVMNSWAVPIPILNERVLENAKRLDSEIKLVVADVHGREPIFEITYADVWRQAKVTFDASKCISCDVCEVSEVCPTGAFDAARKKVNEVLCFNCGTCVRSCVAGAFSAQLGRVVIEGREVLVTARQSDRHKAEKLAELLKRRILEGSFTLSPPVEKLKF